MKRTLVPTEGPKLRLLEAAETLFAQNGFEVVSVRDITQAAGSNVAAVNYHFGSRDALVALVMTRYLVPINEERLVRLEAAEARWASQAVPLEEVVDAFVRPLITRVEKSTLAQPLFLRLVGRIFASHSESWPNEIEAKASVLIDRFTRSLGKALPTLPEEDLVWRLHFVVGAIIHMLLHGQTTQRLEPRVGGAPEMAATMEQLLSFAVAGLRGGVMSPDAGVAVPSGDAGDGHRPPLQDADQVLEDGHRPLLQDAEEPLPAKKRPKKAALNSPQVMFEF